MRPNKWRMASSLPLITCITYHTAVASDWRRTARIGTHIPIPPAGRYYMQMPHGRRVRIRFHTSSHQGHTNPCNHGKAGYPDMTTLSGVPTATGLCVPQRIRGPHQAPPLWLSSVRRHGLNATCLQQMKDPRRCLPAEPFQLAARNLAPLMTRDCAQKAENVALPVG